MISNGINNNSNMNVNIDKKNKNKNKKTIDRKNSVKPFIVYNSNSNKEILNKQNLYGNNSAN